MDDGVKDDLRSVNVALPRLPEEGALHDVSSFAGQWWNQLMEHVRQVYKQW